MVRTRDSQSGTSGESLSKKESSSTARTSKASSSGNGNKSNGSKKNGSTGVWPCKINGCTKQFAREADLKRHQRTTKLHATSVAGSQCPQCDATFTRTDALRRHQKSRHNGVVIEPENDPADDEDRADASSGMDDGEDSLSGNSGRRTDSPPLVSEARKSRDKHRSSTKYRKLDPDQSPDSPYYRSAAYDHSAHPAASRYSHVGLPVSSTRLNDVVSWSHQPDQDVASESDDYSEDEDAVPAPAHPQPLAYPSPYYRAHYSTPLTNSAYYDMYRPDEKAPRSKRGGAYHWKTSSQRTTASDREMSLTPSENGHGAPYPSVEDNKMQAIAVALSANALRNIKSSSRSGTPSSSSSRAQSVVNGVEDHNGHNGYFKTSYSPVPETRPYGASRYLDSASSLRSTQSYDDSPPSYNTARPQPRHQNSATRSTVDDDEEEVAPGMDVDPEDLYPDPVDLKTDGYADYKLDRPPPMELLVGDDGYPMLNPAELLTQESLVTSPSPY